jgi:succinate dehydrogenase/fumarate reductase cytochrome b subunit
MATVGMILKGITGVIYILFAIAVLYFPFAGLLELIARKMRLLEYHPTITIEDVLLPGLFLALLYRLVAAVRKRIESACILRESGQGPAAG